MTTATRRATAISEDLAYALTHLHTSGIPATTNTDSIGRPDTGTAATITITGTNALTRALATLDRTDPWHRWNTVDENTITNAAGTVRVIAQRTHHAAGPRDVLAICRRYGIPATAHHTRRDMITVTTLEDLTRTQDTMATLGYDADWDDTRTTITGHHGCYRVTVNA